MEKSCDGDDDEDKEEYLQKVKRRNEDEWHQHGNGVTAEITVERGFGKSGGGDDRSETR